MTRTKIYQICNFHTWLENCLRATTLTDNCGNDVADNVNLPHLQDATSMCDQVTMSDANLFWSETKHDYVDNGPVSWKKFYLQWLWNFLMKYIFPCSWMTEHSWLNMEVTSANLPPIVTIGTTLQRYACRYAIQSYSFLWNCINLMHQIDFDFVQEWQGAGIFGKLYNWLRRWLSVFVLAISADLLP